MEDSTKSEELKIDQIDGGWGGRSLDGYKYSKLIISWFDILLILQLNDTNS